MNQFKEITTKEFKKNVFEIIGEEWMLVTAKKENKVNTMTASWGGLGVMWGRDVAYVVIRPQRYTKEFVDASDTFSLTFYPSTYKSTLGYLGRVSGRNEDKILNSNLTITYEDGTPYFEEANLVLICKKLYAQPMDEPFFMDSSIPDKWYQTKDYHTLYVAEIQKVFISK